GQFTPGGESDVFGGGHPAAEELHVTVQVPVIHVVDKVTADGCVEIPQVDDHAGLCVRRALHAHLQDVVVAVVGRAGTEDLSVVGFIPLRTAEDVCGSEGGAACDPHALAWLQ